VDPAQHDRCEGDTRGSSAGKGGERVLQVDGQSELGKRLLRARLKVAAPSREEVVERLGIRRYLLGLGSQARCELIDAPLGLRDSGAPGEVAAQRLAGQRIALLRQEADGEAGCRANRPAVGLLDTCEQA